LNFPPLRIQRRYIEARYEATARIFGDGADLVDSLAGRFPVFSRRQDGALWTLKNDQEFRIATLAQTNAVLDCESCDTETEKFIAEAQDYLTTVADKLRIRAFTRVGFAQYVIVPRDSFDHSLSSVMTKMLNPLFFGKGQDPLSEGIGDMAITLDIKSGDWSGRIQFGPYNPSVNMQLFQYKQAPGLQDIRGGYIFKCDFWQARQFSVHEVASRAEEASRLIEAAVSHIVKSIEGDGE
jgi:hypothetical protein